MGYHLEASLANDPERGDWLVCQPLADSPPLSRPAPDGARRGSRGQGLVSRGGLIRLVPNAAPRSQVVPLAPPPPSLLAPVVTNPNAVLLPRLPRSCRHVVKV